jgi:hypothetical protein
MNIMMPSWIFFSDLIRICVTPKRRILLKQSYSATEPTFAYLLNIVIHECFNTSLALIRFLGFSYSILSMRSFDSGLRVFQILLAY